ncbi:MAG: dTDP-4-amino-4,6-dideoxygalactose transaminase [Bacteroidales bacterium]|nr:dTDP-4-amino-4,6-dideoxygalactose transaminase [Bacteroidales bacterium]MCF8386935.1 dTDP-4-amino-4,6-dideoxygalactose transaminase [Bacteroidales bacterium]MCF8399362.1 dTDP-4-amino-4,6-dideoxygalactose transaminase [Bacteroidales bacterium]
MKVYFNQPYMAGNEKDFVIDGTMTGHISGHGKYTRLCHQWFEKNYKIKKSLLTTSCSDALEMAALLLEIQSGDEVIMPSFTFVSTANAFVLRGAKIVFADVREDIPIIDADSLEELITEKTRAILPVHYAGIACEMNKIMDLAKKYKLHVVEDAAHAIHSTYGGKQLGTIGTLGTFSFHETKNVICGEGGMIAVNDKKYEKRSEILWEKGTDRAAFHRGEVKKYQWVDVGSSYLPSDLIAAVLYGQLQKIEEIQKMRIAIWHKYYERLKPLEIEGKVKLPVIPDWATNNGHMFYLVTNTPAERDKLLKHLNKKGVMAVIHYLPLHSSKYYRNKYDGPKLPNTEMFSSCLLRLPFYNLLNDEQIDYVVGQVRKFYQ